jgi:hypothetical protein
MGKKYGHLDEQERALIETPLTLGLRPSAIAEGPAVCITQFNLSSPEIGGEFYIQGFREFSI